MAVGASSIVEIRTGGSDTANSGGFDPTTALNTFATNLAAASANTSSPVVTSATYNFVAGDVNAYLYIKSGTNWIPGWYKIVSVAANAATLGAAVATVASPTTGTWSIDYSQQNAAAFAYTDLASTGAGAVISSAGFPFQVAHVGNWINIQSGTNFTAGVYQIISVNSGTHLATLDRSATTGVGATGVGGMGGALASVTKANSSTAANTKLWAATGIYTQTAGTTITAGGVSAAALTTQLNGYNAVRGDIHMQSDGSYSNNQNRPIIKLSTNTGLTAVTCGNAAILRNFIVDCSGLGTSTGVNASTGGMVVNVKVKNFTTRAFNSTAVAQFRNVEAVNGTSAATAAVTLGNGCCIIDSNIHDNACPGITTAGNAYAFGNLVVNNSGASSNGIQGTGSNAGLEGCVFIGNTVIGNGLNGIASTASNDTATAIIKNNIMGKNAGSGFKGSSAAGSYANSNVDGNAYWFNTTADRTNADDTTSFYNLDNPYTNVMDVTLTRADANNPFVRYGISGSTYSATDLAVDASVNTKVTSATYTFVAGDVGSTICIPTDTGGWSEGTYTVQSVTAGAATLDRSPAATSTTGGTYYFNDFRLNNTAAMGASLRAAGYPGVMPGGGTLAGKRDMGVYQHADPAGGGGGSPIVGSPIVNGVI